MTSVLILPGKSTDKAFHGVGAVITFGEVEGPDREIPVRITGSDARKKHQQTPRQDSKSGISWQHFQILMEFFRRYNTN